MPSLEIPAGLADLAPRYDALVCDVWGVVHNGRASFPDACDALARYRDGGGTVVLVSNSPRPKHGFVAQLRDLGVPDASWNEVITSGDATRSLLARRAPGPAWAVGPARDAALYEGLGLDLTETADKAAFISCSGLFDDEIEVPEDYRERFRTAVERGLTMICANPDKVVRRGEQMIWCAGALADLYAELGGEVVMAGKPFSPIYDLAREAISAASAGDVADQRILVIGDGVPTDVKGANEQGLDCLFVVEGIHAAELAHQGGLDAARVEAFLSREGVHARYALDGLRWQG
jgi:HAD superfamily hydrolase (TIGR01459 family)